MYPYGYEDSSVLFPALFGSLVIVYIILFSVYVICLIGMWKVFEKAGKPGWAALIPFYNLYILYEITFGNGWLFFLNLVPIANIVISILCMDKLSKAFGQGTGFVFGLLLVNPVFICILGFDDKYTYLGIPEKA